MEINIKHFAVSSVRVKRVVHRVRTQSVNAYNSNTVLRHCSNDMYM